MGVSDFSIIWLFIHSIGISMGMVFGTAGIPLRCEGGTLEGMQCVSDLKLKAMELEFVHSVNLKEEGAKKVADTAGKLGLVLSVHAPYYINLLSEEKHKRDASRMRIAESCRIGGIASASRIVFHPAFYGKMEKGKALEEMKVQISMILDELEERKVGDVVLAPEVMGKVSQFGTIGENFSLSAEFGIGSVNPCIDFGHLHARTNGGLKKKSDFAAILDEVGGYGKKYLQTLHIHFEGINYTEKGERNHLPISSNSPDFSLLAEALVEKGCSGTIICESPELENDALKMKEIYEGILKG
ncbi:MAG: TIM barrel protein [Candidatus Micrarchaeota archaeon]